MAAKTRYSPRKTGMMVDIAHIFIGISVLIMAVFAVFRPQKYMVLFPVIFLLTALLDLISAWYLFKTVQRQKGRFSVLIYLLLGLAFLALFIISAISIWIA